MIKNKSHRIALFLVCFLLISLPILGSCGKANSPQPPQNEETTYPGKYPSK
jgi:hypothetical protein